MTTTHHPPGRNARRDQRVCVRGRLSLQDKEGASWNASLRDLSVTGARITSDEALQPGARLTALVECDAGLAPLTLSAVVAWCDAPVTAESSQYLAGLQFADLPEPQQQALLKFVDGQMWRTLAALRDTPLLAELNDLERMQLGTVCVLHELNPGQEIDADDLVSGVVLVNRGTVELTEVGPRGETTRDVGAAGICGHLPSSRPQPRPTRLVAKSAATMILLPADGFWHLCDRQPTVALRVLHAYAGCLEEVIAAARGGVPVMSP